MLPTLCFPDAQGQSGRWLSTPWSTPHLDDEKEDDVQVTRLDWRACHPRPA